MDWLERSNALRPLSPSLIRQIHARVAADLSPVKPLLPSGFFEAAFFLAFAIVAGLSLFWLRPLGLWAMGTGSALTVISVLGLVTSVLTGSLTRQMIPGSLHRVAPAWIPPVALMILGSFLWGLFPRHGITEFWKTGWVCVRVGSLFAIPVGVVLFVTVRKGAVTTPRTAGGTAGLIAGLTGVTVLEVHCPLLEASHIVTWHLGVALISAAAGAALSSLLEARRRT
jgi:hypothetical protein